LRNISSARFSTKLTADTSRKMLRKEMQNMPLSVILADIDDMKGGG
jgi:hypothetical protein